MKKDYILEIYKKSLKFEFKDTEEIIKLFEKAKSKDKLLTLKCIFYIGDIEKGLGEKRVFRILVKYIADKYPEIIIKNLRNIGYYGRWDVLIDLLDSSLENEILEIIGCQLANDILSDEPSQLVKWLPSPNAKSKKNQRYGVKIAKYLKLSGRVGDDTLDIIRYREIIKELNEKISVKVKKIENKKDVEFKNSFSKINSYIKSIQNNYEKFNFQDFKKEILKKDISKMKKKLILKKLSLVLEKFNSSSGICILDEDSSNNSDFKINSKIILSNLILRKRLSSFYTRCVQFSP